MTSLTIHGKQRLKERADTNVKNIALFKCALKNGKDIIKFNEEFAGYLIAKSKMKYGVKVYRENIYIYSRSNKNKRLITVLHVPEKYLPLEDYMIKKIP